MADYGWYIFKVSICISLFYAFYALILRKCTFFLLNRIFLISGLLLSFLIPALNISITGSQLEDVGTNMIYPFLVEMEHDFIQPQTSMYSTATFSYSGFFSTIYFMGITVLLFKLLFFIKRIIRISAHSKAEQIDKIKIIRVEEVSPFSFFNRIFLPKEENNPLIIKHEMAHIKQYHWFDLILMEVISLLLWFNPFIYLYKRALKLQHEYLADTNVVENESLIEDYLHCMLHQIQMVNLGGIVSQFYCKTTKKRILMITKDKTTHKYKGIYLLTLPLVCLMLSAFSVSYEMGIKEDVITIQPKEIKEPSIYPIDAKKVRRITGYGEWVNPKTKKKGFHYGIDFALPEGEEVYSTADGFVAEAAFDAAKGNYIIIRHNEVFSTFYSHLKSILVEVGDQLKEGQVIGLSGNTGTATTGPHLHYGILKDGEYINPQNYLPE